MVAKTEAALGAAPDSIEYQIQAGNFREATAMCCKQHGASIGRLCMASLGNQAEAEETTQEVLIAAHDGMANFRFEGSVKAWLCSIARRKCAKRLAKRIRRERRLRLVHDAALNPDLPDDVAERHRRARVLRNALEELKPSEREVVLLRYEADLSYREIALACDIEEPTARKRTSRALVRLRDLLQSEIA